MRRLFHGIHKRPKITKNELVADTLFIAISGFVSFALVFIFDIHHSFYPGNSILAPKFIFTNYTPYIIGILLGSLAGFFVLKILVYGFMLEETELKKKR